MAQPNSLHATASTPSHAHQAPQGGNVCQSNEALTDAFTADELARAKHIVLPSEVDPFPRLPHRLSEADLAAINAPTFADYFDEYACWAMGIVAAGLLAMAAILWGAF